MGKWHVPFRAQKGICHGTKQLKFNNPKTTIMSKVRNNCRLAEMHEEEMVSPASIKWLDDKMPKCYVGQCFIPLRTGVERLDKTGNVKQTLYVSCQGGHLFTPATHSAINGSKCRRTTARVSKRGSEVVDTGQQMAMVVVATSVCRRLGDIFCYTKWCSTHGLVHAPNRTTMPSAARW